MRPKKALCETPLTAVSLPVNQKSALRRREIRLTEQAELDRQSSKPLGPPSAPPQLLPPVDQLPDPWLFDSEKLLRELDRCREMMLNVPNNGDQHATHFALNIAIDTIWNLREQLRYLLSLHREGQRQFAKKAS